MTDDVCLKLLTLLTRKLLKEPLAPLRQLYFLLVLVQQVKHVPHRDKGVVRQLHIVVVDALSSIPSRVLQLWKNQVGTLYGGVLSSPHALTRKQIQASSVGSICPLTATNCAWGRFRQSRIQSTLIVPSGLTIGNSMLGSKRTFSTTIVVATLGVRGSFATTSHWSALDSVLGSATNINWQSTRSLAKHQILLPSNCGNSVK